MALAMPTVWSDRHRLHEPGGEIWVGVRTPGTELPERAERIREALTEEGARFVEATEHTDEPLLAVHDQPLLDHLAGAWAEWKRVGLVENSGQDRVVPYVFPNPGLFRDREPAVPAAMSARAGFFAYDTMSLIGPGTWDAARAAIDSALTAADLVLAGERAAYACCRPPGHHAARACFGGSCYLNNTAAAAARLRDALEGPVAVIDIDAHHGNGTQAIFWEDPDVLVGSVHVDPGAGWFPHFEGFATETGAGAGAGANRNVTVAPGSEDDAWLAAIGSVVEWTDEGGAVAAVVALGVDAAAGDPESPTGVSFEGFERAGAMLGAMGMPTVFVQEGGYELETLGPLVRTTLSGFEA